MSYGKRVSREKVAEMLALGIPNVEIATALDCTPKAISAIKHELAGRKQTTIGRPPEIDRGKARRLLQQGMSNLAIAAQLKVRPNKIPTLKRELGFAVNGYRKGTGRRAIAAQGGPGPSVANRIATAERHADNRDRAHRNPENHTARSQAWSLKSRLQQPDLFAPRVSQTQPAVNSNTRAVPIEPQPLVDSEASEARNVELGAVAQRGCRWPVTPFEAKKHLFCNAPQDAKSSYCPHHHGRAVVRRPAEHGDIV
jgi:hypothetical protein